MEYSYSLDEEYAFSLLVGNIFRHDFHPICSLVYPACSFEVNIETTAHVHCPNYLSERELNSLAE